MGKVIVKVRMWNVLDEDRIRSREIAPHEEECLIDAGAVSVVIPPRIVERLKLRLSGKTKVTYANMTSAVRDTAIDLRLEVMGRDTLCRAIVEPDRDQVLIGQIALEDWDLMVDCCKGTLVPRPESPDMPMHEIF